jgi:methylated-DNA-[protein]-cysteine S-methyltransferase
MKFHPATVQTGCPSPLGAITLAASPRGLAGVWFDGQRHQPLAITGPVQAWPRDTCHPVLQLARQQLAEYFAGQRQHFDMPLDLSGGTDFQQTVWQALLAIAPGHTESYGQVSQRIGKPTAVRAVGAAIGRNPLSIIVPCHRVLGANGSLTGYAGGLPRKTHLLTLEGALSCSTELLP